MLNKLKNRIRQFLIPPNVWQHIQTIQRSEQEFEALRAELNTVKAQLAEQTSRVEASNRYAEHWHDVCRENLPKDKVWECTVEVNRRQALKK